MRDAGTQQQDEVGCHRRDLQAEVYKRMDGHQNGRADCNTRNDCISAPSEYATSAGEEEHKYRGEKRQSRGNPELKHVLKIVIMGKIRDEFHIFRAIGLEHCFERTKACAQERTLSESLQGELVDFRPALGFQGGIRDS